MSTPSSPLVDDSAAASTTVYAVRSISWDQTTLPNGTVIPQGVIFADAVLEERHDDDSIITENPVEIGSVTNDHAYDLPQELELTYVFSPASHYAQDDPSFLNNVYDTFLTLKQAKVMLNIVTGKRSYENMLVKSLSVTTDKDTENVLMLRAALRQLLLTYTQTVTIGATPATQQTLPEKTMPIINEGAVNLQSAQNFNDSGAPDGTDTSATPYTVPTQPTNQTFSVMMAGVQRQLTVRWNQMNAAWHLDLADTLGNPVLTGLPLITGTDLLAPFKYMNFGGQLIAQTANDATAVPTLANLGSGANLYFLPKL